jgi:hypothetical protein
VTRPVIAIAQPAPVAPLGQGISVRETLQAVSNADSAGLMPSTFRAAIAVMESARVGSAPPTVDRLSFDTRRRADSTQSIKQGNWYLLLAVPTHRSTAVGVSGKGAGAVEGFDCEPGRLPHQVGRGSPAADAQEAAAETWGWTNNLVPASPEGNVESEMSLVTKLAMNLAAPCRQSATLP